MIAPLPFSLVRDQLFVAQRELNPTLTEPIINRRALLVLSRPTSSVMVCDDEMTAMEFFGLWWIHSDREDYGWFRSEEDAVDHLKALLTG